MAMWALRRRLHRSIWLTNHMSLTQCAKNENGIIIDVKMLGGYNLLGGMFTATKPFSKRPSQLPAGDYVISFDFYHLDNWQGEQAYLQTKSGTFGYQNGPVTTPRGATTAPRTFAATTIIGITPDSPSPKSR